MVAAVERQMILLPKGQKPLSLSEVALDLGRSYKTVDVWARTGISIGKGKRAILRSVFVGAERITCEKWRDEFLAHKNKKIRADVVSVKKGKR